MWARTILPNLAIGGLAACLLVSSSPRSDGANPEGDAQPGVEVLTRGPVHEGFAQPTDGEAKPGAMIPKAPPAEIDEEPPAQKPEGDNVQWVPGYWQWDDEKADFLWVSGFWRQPPPGRRWVPGHYVKTDGGYQWVAGFWAGAEQKELSYVPQPPESVEAGPSVEPPSADATYIPGTWVYNDLRFRWRPGYFVAYRPGWIWHPAQYIWTPAGFVFVNGYWDYPLDTRGLLFASAYVSPLAYGRPGFVYRPSYVVSPYFLTSALFVRPRWGHYYVGDYFDAGYRRGGYTAFIDFRFGRGHLCDPLYNYYHVAHAHGTWERDLRHVYDGRYRGDYVRPPRTLAEQQTLVRTLPTDRRTTKLSDVTVVSSLSKSDVHGVKLTQVSRDQLVETRKTVKEARDVSVERERDERTVVARSGALKLGDTPRVTKLAPTTIVSKTPVAPPPVPLEKKIVTTPRETTVTKPKVETPPVITKPKVETPPVITKPKVETPPVVTKPKIETPPVVTKPKVETPPVVIKRDPPPMPKKETVPPPPPPKKDPAPVIKRESTPPPPLPKKDPAPVIRREPTPAPKVAPPPPRPAPPPPKVTPRKVTTPAPQQKVSTPTQHKVMASPQHRAPAPQAKPHAAPQHGGKPKK